MNHVKGSQISSAFVNVKREEKRREDEERLKEIERANAAAKLQATHAHTHTHISHVCKHRGEAVLAHVCVSVCVCMLQATMRGHAVRSKRQGSEAPEEQSVPKNISQMDNYGNYLEDQQGEG